MDEIRPIRIGTIDIETAPNKVYTWGVYEQNAIRVLRPWYILGFSYRWLGEKKVHSHYICDYKGGAKKQDDKVLMQDLWNFLNEADVVVAHYGSGFDIPKIRAKLLTHGFTPPSPFKVVDTKKALESFGFDSKHLDDMGKTLGLGAKLSTGGFSLWERCMEGEKKAFEEMRKYNIQDVVLCEELYLKLLPWLPNHPNRNIFTKQNNCPRCGGHKTVRRGFETTATGRKQRVHCLASNCGAWFYEGSAKKVQEVTLR